MQIYRFLNSTNLKINYGRCKIISIQLKVLLYLCTHYEPQVSPYSNLPAAYSIDDIVGVLVFVGKRRFGLLQSDYTDLYQDFYLSCFYFTGIVHIEKADFD